MNKPLHICGSLLARNTILNFIGQAMPLLVGVVTILFIVRGLGTERLGLLPLQRRMKNGTVPFSLFCPLPENDPKRRCPDITKIRELLGWEPEVSLEEGLHRTIDYFKGVFRR